MRTDPLAFVSAELDTLREQALARPQQSLAGLEVATAHSVLRKSIVAAVIERGRFV
jgi:hypothetical protein